MLSRMLAVTLFSALMLTIVGCEKEGPAEEAGAKLDEAIEEGKENVEDTVESAGDKLEQAGDKIENKTQ